MITDISEYQPSIPGGSWDAIICRVTHDRVGVDKRVAQHFPNALRAPLRGVYHFWNPTLSSGVEQAELMASNALRLGFRPNVDLWALDSEAAALPSHAANAAWVEDFMAHAHARLGGRGLWYIGWPYYLANFGSDFGQLRLRPWWLPAYGPNDGAPHGFSAPFDPVLHQYTSRGGPGGSGLDVSRIVDWDRWRAMLGAMPPAPAPKPSPPRYSTHSIGEDVKITDIQGIHLDSHGNGFVDVPGVPFSRVVSVLVIGGSDPFKVGRYDRTPAARAIQAGNVARIVIELGEPAGTYTIRVAHN